MQKLGKKSMESEVSNLSLLLGKCFYEKPKPQGRNPDDLTILKFSPQAIPNVSMTNFVTEFVIEADPKFFDEFNKELDSLENVNGK